MDTNTATFTGPLEPQQLKAAAHILKYALPELLVAKFGSQHGVPSNTGDQIKFTYFEFFPVTGVPSVEGITPASVPLVRKNVTLTLQQYITWTPITDWTIELHPDNIMEPILQNLATWMSQTVELVTLNALLAGTNVLYAGGVASRLLVNSTVSRAMVGRVEEIFRTNAAKKIKKMMSGSLNVGTVPVAESFVGIITSSMADDVTHCTNFKPVDKYASPTALLPNEIGNVDGVRFCTSNFLKYWSAAATSVDSGQTTYRSAGADAVAGYPDVHPIIFLAENAFGCANLNRTKSGQVVLKKPGTGDSGDPAGQRGSAAIKFWFGAVILTDLYLIRGEVACTSPSKQPW